MKGLFKNPLVVVAAILAALLGFRSKLENKEPFSQFYQFWDKTFSQKKNENGSIVEDQLNPHLEEDIENMG